MTNDEKMLAQFKARLRTINKGPKGNRTVTTIKKEWAVLRNASTVVRRALHEN